MLRPAALISGLILANLLPFAPAHALVGGAVATGSELGASSTVGIHDNARGVTSCTGVLISKRLVLTAAHCVLGQAPENSPVVFYYRRGEETKIPSARIIPHENFKDTEIPDILDFGKTYFAMNDIAMILLAEPAPSFAIPAAVEPHSLKGMAQVVTFGLGLHLNGSSYEVDGNMRYAKFWIKPMISDQLTAWSENGDTTCNGDSGGPSYRLSPHKGRPVLVALTSAPRVVRYFNAFKEPPCAKVPEANYISVAEHVSWIRATSAKLAR